MARLGSVLSRLGKVFGRLGGVIGRLTSVLGYLGSVFGRLGGVMGASQALNRRSGRPGPGKGERVRTNALASDTWLSVDKEWNISKKTKEI